MPRVCEVGVSEWDRRRGVIRDIFEFHPRIGRRVPIADLRFDLAIQPELEALLRSGSGGLASLDSGEGTSDAQVTYLARFGWRSLLQVPLGVLVMDVDDFKRLNDEHGHAHGDRVLRRTAERSSASTRAGPTPQGVSAATSSRCSCRARTATRPARSPSGSRKRSSAKGSRCRSGSQSRPGYPPRGSASSRQQTTRCCARSDTASAGSSAQHRLLPIGGLHDVFDHRP